VNLIGEHTDYNDGFVLPAAIHFQTTVTISPREDRRLWVRSSNLNESAEFELGNRSARPRKDWTDYVFGVAVMLERAGRRVLGADLVIQSDVPLGAGLSSSAALEASAALALTQCSGLSLPRLELARLCQQAESEFVGMRCGIMDQFISLHGERGHAVLLDCRSLEHRTFPLPEGASLVIANSMVKHELASSEYNARRAVCEEGAGLLGVAALRDAASAESLPEILRPYCRHVISENARVRQATKALASGLTRFGTLMYESHASLRDDYRVSCAELDALVDLARRAPGVIGARMTGGGFGGCTVNLVKAECVDAFCAHLAAGYEQAMGRKPDIYVTRAVDGASEV
jgi:galactokinase